MKLDRSRAALVVVDVQEAFRPAVLDFEQVAAQRRDARAGRRDPRAADAVTEQYPKGLGHTVPEVAEHLDGVTPIEKVCFSAVDAEAFAGALHEARPRPGAAVRHRDPRLREPDRRGPARRRDRGPRRPGRGHVAHGREPGARTAQDGALRRGRDQRRDRPVRAAAPGRHARVQGSPGSWSNERATCCSRTACGSTARPSARRARGRRGRLQHRHDRLPGGGHRPLLRGPDHHLHLSADRQLRRLAAGDGVRPPARPRGDHARGRETPRRRAPAEAGSTGCAAGGVAGIGGVDTRGLVRHIRDRGAMRGGIFPGDMPERGGARPDRGRAADAGPRPRARGDARRADRRRRGRRARAWWRSTPASRPRSSATSSSAGCRLELLPCTTAPAEVLAREPDAVFLANGPGDPAALDYVVGNVRELVGKVPVFGHLPRPPAPVPRGRPRDLQAAVRPPRRQPPGQGPRDRARSRSRPRTTASPCVGPGGEQTVRRRRAGALGDRLRRGRAVAREPLRPHGRGARAARRARRLRPVPPRGGPGPARLALPVRPVPGDGRDA